jgi:hypothetical protein
VGQHREGDKTVSRAANFALAAASVLWLATGAAWFYSPPPPVVGWVNSSVEPIKAKAGDTIEVSRTFTATRDESMLVTRTMVKGDCKKACEIIDLPSSTLNLTRGDYTGIKREFIIPITASPGVWTLRFSIHWQNWVGRTLTQALPELTVEVVK